MIAVSASTSSPGDAEFGKLNHALFTRTFLAAGSAGTQRGASGPVTYTDGRSQFNSKRCKIATCYAWNDGKTCIATPCRFSHVCSRCGGDNKMTAWERIPIMLVLIE